MKKEIKRHILSILAVLTFLLLSTVFIYMPNHNNMASALTFLNGVQSFYMEDLSDGVLLKDANPTMDEDGLESEPYKFQVVNKSNRNITYKIVFKNKVDNEEERLANKYLRYSISTENGTEEAMTLSDDSIILTTTITPNTTQVFNFRMWLDYNSDDDAFGKRFSGVIQIEEA